MGLEGKKVLVYTAEGDFVRLPMPSKLPEIGDVIELEGRVKKPLTAYFAIAAALVLVMVAGLFSPLSGTGEAAAYVALDINPSTGLYVNREGKVIKVKSLNHEAETLLAEAGVNGQDLYGAVGSIIIEADRLGYMNNGTQNLVMAGIVHLKGGATAVKEEELNKVIRERLASLGVEGSVVVGSETGEMMAQAEDAGLSLNKYMVYDRAQTEGLNIPVEELRNNSIQQALNKADIPLKRIFPTECTEVRRAAQPPTGNSGAGAMENGMSRGQAEMQQYNSDMGPAGGGERGSTGSMGEHNSSPAASNGGGMMPVNSDRQVPERNNVIPQNDAGKMQTSLPDGTGQAPVHTTGGGSAGEMPMGQR